MKSIVLFAVILLFPSLQLGFAQELSRTLYDQGKFQEALEAIQKNGLTTASDYYNAGNCYFRLNKPGQALSFYEKAATLAPSNGDIHYNMRLAEETIAKTAALPMDNAFWSGHFVPVARHLSEPLVDLLLAFVTVGFAFVVYRLKDTRLSFRRALLHPRFLGMLGVWIFVCLFALGTVLAHRTKLAAIIADTGVARSGPSETFTELFKLPAGAKVELTGEGREGWQQVRFSLGNVGWMMDKDLLPL